jgi:hypothetical protein
MEAQWCAAARRGTEKAREPRFRRTMRPKPSTRLARGSRTASLCSRHLTKFQRERQLRRVADLRKTLISDPRSALFSSRRELNYSVARSCGAAIASACGAGPRRWRHARTRPHLLGTDHSARPTPSAGAENVDGNECASSLALAPQRK